MYAIHLPSGDHAGCDSSSLELTMLRASEPSASTTNRSPLRANAIRVPSGDHVGCRSSAFVDVSRRVPVPSAFMT